MKFDNIPHAFGVALSKRRKKKKMSRMELAAKAGLHLNAVSSLENKKRAPSLHTVFRLSAALGLHPKTLVIDVVKMRGRLREFWKDSPSAERHR